MRPRNRVLVLAVTALVAATTAASAQAHGDLASEYLVDHDVFLPVHSSVPASTVASLASVLGAAAHDRLPVKVALIAKPADLGRRTSFFGHPQRYAQWVTEDMYADYHGRLLVVMPDGYGASVGGGPDPTLARAASRLAPAGAHPVAMVRAAIAAVRNLAAANGHALAAATARPAGHASTTARDRVKIAVILAALLLVVAAGSIVRRRRRGLRAAGRARSSG